MSRIGRQPIAIPEGVTVQEKKGQIVVQGPEGGLEVSIPSSLDVKVADKQIIVQRKSDKDRAIHGLQRSLIANAVQGVAKGFEKRLELVGTGYRVKQDGDNLTLTLGFSHPVKVEKIEGIILETEGEKEIIIKGIDKQKVGQIAANIRSLRKPEPYKGKGIRYKGEIVRRKPGKAAKVGAEAE